MGLRGIGVGSRRHTLAAEDRANSRISPSHSAHALDLVPVGRACSHVGIGKVSAGLKSGMRTGPGAIGAGRAVELHQIKLGLPAVLELDRRQQNGRTWRWCEDRPDLEEAGRRDPIVRGPQGISAILDLRSILFSPVVGVGIVGIGAMDVLPVVGEPIQVRVALWIADLVLLLPHVG